MIVACSPSNGGSVPSFTVNPTGATSSAVSAKSSVHASPSRTTTTAPQTTQAGGTTAYTAPAEPAETTTAVQQYPTTTLAQGGDAGGYPTTIPRTIVIPPGVNLPPGVPPTITLPPGFPTELPR